jgi:hypothetical protein
MKAESSDPVLAEAWNAWAAGDFQGARTLSEALVAETVTSDAGHFMLALVSHVTGDYGAAIEHSCALSRRYPGRRALAETILESYLLLRDVPGARQFAREQRLGASVRRVLDAAIQRPLRVEIDGVAVLPFVDDPLTPMMLGVAARINGYETVARLDTGGTFVHASEEQARLWGIETVANERTFASPATMTVCFGPADFELGPIFGTNVLQQFLSTIAPHAGRLILSSRDDPDARAEHEALLAAGASATIERR